MAFDKPLQNYVRSPVPALPESKQKWIEEELRKIERISDSIYETLGPLTLNMDASGGVVFFNMPTPAAKTATATLTAAELLTTTVTVTSAAAVTLTLPTGTLLSTAIGDDLPLNRAFEWSVINRGSSSGTVTIAASTGHTIVGSSSVPIGTSAVFKTRKTAANTFVTYRL